MRSGAEYYLTEAQNVQGTVRSVTTRLPYKKKKSTVYFLTGFVLFYQYHFFLKSLNLDKLLVNQYNSKFVEQN